VPFRVTRRSGTATPAYFRFLQTCSASSSLYGAVRRSPCVTRKPSSTP
jgi:hypothetical protein